MSKKNKNNFQLRHLPSNGFVRRTLLDNNKYEYYVADPGILGIPLADSEWREAIFQLCFLESGPKFLMEEFILIRDFT